MGNICKTIRLSSKLQTDKQYLVNFSGSNIPASLQSIHNKYYTFNEFIIRLSNELNKIPSIKRIEILRYLDIDEDQFVNIPMHNTIIILPEYYPDILETLINTNKLLG